MTKTHDFTNDVNEMKGWLRQCYARGGGDLPEAVADGLQQVLTLSWRDKATKICALISDAPPHGLDKNVDSFPDGCPLNFDPIKIVRQMAQNNITLYTIGVEPPISLFVFFISLTSLLRK